MNQAQKSFRQILTCCASNDAVNNVCRSTHETFPHLGAMRVYPFGIEEQHVFRQECVSFLCQESAKE